MNQWNDARLELLHDHYKDTFSINREREKQRDLLFYFVVALFGVLFLELGYPANFLSIFTEVEAQGAKINLAAIPYGALTSVTWTLMLAIAMRYCQISTHVERQYRYLHRIEEKICSVIGDEEVFCREGKSYFQDYPMFSNWAWFFYTVMFPLIIAMAIIFALYIEWALLRTPVYHQIFDTVIALAIFITFTLYRTIPQIKRKITIARPKALKKQRVIKKTKL